MHIYYRVYNYLARVSSTGRTDRTGWKHNTDSASGTLRINLLRQLKGNLRFPGCIGAYAARPTPRISGSLRLLISRYAAASFEFVIRFVGHHSFEFAFQIMYSEASYNTLHRVRTMHRSFGAQFVTVPLHFVPLEQIHRDSAWRSIPAAWGQPIMIFSFALWFF